MDTYKDFYIRLTGFSPYEYQQKIAELLLGGKNIILGSSDISRDAAIMQCI